MQAFMFPFFFLFFFLSYFSFSFVHMGNISGFGEDRHEYHERTMR